MDTLPHKLRKNGYDYTIVCRGKKSVIYRQGMGENLIAFEVFLIHIRPEKNIKGKILPVKEKFPSNEDFGYSSWTYWTLEQAMEKFNEIER